MGGGEGDTSRSWTSGKGGMKLRANAGVKIDLLLVPPMGQTDGKPEVQGAW